MRCLWVLLAILIPPAFAAAHPAAADPAPAAPNIGIRQGRHGDMGRLVFDFPAATRFHSKRVGSVLTIVFTPPQPIGSIKLHIPGVQEMQGGAGTVRLQLLPGATPHIYRLGNRVVVDTRPPGAEPPWQAAVPRADPSPIAKAPAPAKLILAAAVQPAKPPARAAAARTRPRPAPSPAPMPAPAATPTATPTATSTASVSPPQIVTFATQPGAAAFRRGDQAIIVFDTSEIPDITALQSAPPFAGAGLVSLQDAQVITVPLPATDALALTPVSGGWQVAAIPATQPLPAPLQNAAAAVEFPMQSANHSIIISDPLTGGDLLVGTVTQASDAANFTESGPGYAVLPAWLGVVIVPQADDLGLNASLKGFELVSDAANGLPLGSVPPPAAIAAPVGLSGQSLSLPPGSVADLWKRLNADARSAAILPPLGRLGAQIALAQDMLALGLGPEATGVLATAVLENPASRDNGQIAEMRAIANVLAYHSQPSDFTAPGIVPGTQLAFWRAAGALSRGQQTALPDLIAGLPMFEAYPQALRNAVTAAIAEALADNGQLQAAQQLAESDAANPRLDLARAKILEDQGQAQAALAAYEKLARGVDYRTSAIAAARVVELQLAAGRLNDAQAADALDAQIFNWRSPGHERHMRLRIAQLRAAGGQWVQAFSMLQSARQLFPGQAPQIDAIRAAMFLKMLSGSALKQLSPIEAVALLQQNQDLIAPGNSGAQVFDLLARQLDALDLPGAAAPMLSHLIRTIPQGTAQASLGATLAQVDLDAGSPVAALADLSQTQADGLPPALVSQRNMLAAKAQAAGGNAVAAVNTLAPAAPGPALAAGPPADPQTLDTQAQIAEQSGQWPRAEQALGTLVSQSIPATGPIDTDQENLLLRLATAASHNNDAATLASLASAYGPRVNQDAAGQMFQTLIAPPLTGDQGLNQALHEIAQLQALPAMVNAVAAAPAKPETSSPAH